MKQPTPTVYVIDDDASVLQALGRLVRSAGMHPQLFSSVETFLDIDQPVKEACVVADIRLGGKTGLELPARLRDRHWPLPVIFLTAQDTEATRSAARQAGAAAFFRKPVDDQALLDTIEWVLGNGSRGASDL